MRFLARNQRQYALFSNYFLPQYEEVEESTEKALLMMDTLVNLAYLKKKEKRLFKHKQQKAEID